MPTPEEIAAAIESAQLAFWNEIARLFPTATSGSLPAELETSFGFACDAAVEAWVEAFVPATPPPTIQLRAGDVQVGQSVREVGDEEFQAVSSVDVVGSMVVLTLVEQGELGTRSTVLLDQDTVVERLDT